MSWRETVTHNLGWKVVAAILATLIWLTLHSGVQNKFKASAVRSFYHVEIAVMTAAADDRVFRVEPRSVDVTLRGDPAVLEHLQPSEIEAYVNLTAVAEAKELRRRIQVYVPPRITVEELKPGEVVVHSLRLPTAPAAKPQ